MVYLKLPAASLLSSAQCSISSSPRYWSGNWVWIVLESLKSQYHDITWVVSCLYSLAGVVGGVLWTVSRAVTAEETSSVLGRDGGVVTGPPSLRFHPSPLQDVVWVLTCSWTRDTEPDVQFHVLVRFWSFSFIYYNRDMLFVHLLSFRFSFSSGTQTQRFIRLTPAGAETVLL